MQTISYFKGLLERRNQHVIFLKKRTDDNIMKSCMYVIYLSSEGIQQKSEWDWEWVENALWKTQTPCRPLLEEDYLSFGNSPFSWPLWPDDLCHPNLLFLCLHPLSAQAGRPCCDPASFAQKYFLHIVCTFFSSLSFAALNSPERLS